ncbi:hypothetical protein B0T22DRAFT_477145 [Podospora appendiculata]|uniref:O-methyltransferase domain-containing protein n=1 Tax=Podospora appendiculata TaxID=314037 RepID=A0AAE0XJ32_9PEZI|nr:hypothetical protein B0T22DRAFT_477145 [Podospora appendiculata]
MVEATPGLSITRCVLEDLSSVLEPAKVSADPALAGVKLARLSTNYIRRCLHDYGDADCVGTLQHLSDAMASDSHLLTVEQPGSHEQPAVRVRGGRGPLYGSSWWQKNAHSTASEISLGRLARQS